MARDLVSGHLFRATITGKQRKRYRHGFPGSRGEWVMSEESRTESFTVGPYARRATAISAAKNAWVTHGMPSWISGEILDVKVEMGSTDWKDVS